MLIQRVRKSSKSDFAFLDCLWKTENKARANSKYFTAPCSQAQMSLTALVSCKETTRKNLESKKKKFKKCTSYHLWKENIPFVSLPLLDECGLTVKIQLLKTHRGFLLVWIDLFRDEVPQQAAKNQLQTGLKKWGMLLFYLEVHLPNWSLLIKDGGQRIVSPYGPFLSFFGG